MSLWRNCPDSYVWTFRKDTGTLEHWLAAVSSFACKMVKDFLLTWKRIILSLKEHQPHWRACLSFPLAHSSFLCQNLQPSIHLHLPVRPEKKIDRLSCFKTHLPLADKEKNCRLWRATKTWCWHVSARQFSVDFPTQPPGVLHDKYKQIWKTQQAGKSAGCDGCNRTPLDLSMI